MTKPDDSTLHAADLKAVEQWLNVNLSMLHGTIQGLDMTALVELIKADQRYSYSFDGNAQVLDHFIANEQMKRHLAGFGYLRINADYRS